MILPSFCWLYILLISTLNAVWCSTTTQALNKGKLASRTFCGYQHTDDYFRTDNKTAINEFPWSAILLLEMHDNTTLFPRLHFDIRCSGSLINDRYVLSTADCLVADIVTLVAVRLGEYRINNDTDCTEDPGSNYYECSDPVQDFQVENVMLHPQYRKLSLHHDIALLRLNKKVTYSDFIRPICLPAPGHAASTVGDILSATGWGYVYQIGLTDIKKKVFKRIISNTECQSYFSDFEFSVTDDHFCTMPLEDNVEFTCAGDNGGALMFSSAKRQWQLEGILSFAGDCSKGRPEVYVKVANYVKWIENNVFP